MDGTNPPLISGPHPRHRGGWIEVICGPMFSGKTEELIRRLRRAQIARQEVAIFKPGLDNRYSEDRLVSHSQVSLPSVAVTRAEEILERAGAAQVLGVDEAQFFGPELVGICRELAGQGRRVIIAGLDQDYRGEPFEPVPQLLAEAEYITKTLAICVRCGAPANRTQRLSAESARVVVGAAERYEARCRSCFEPPER
ncbi:MAG: thymidine kinase [Candidatus Zixiibacteriota bacterium]|nr:MAG: thymidine kinase [candidate division Zixibacteria bacterium]